MTMSDQELVNELKSIGKPLGEGDPYDYFEEEDIVSPYGLQWVQNGDTFKVAGDTVKKVPPGLYNPEVNQAGEIYFVKVKVKTEGLLKFPHTASDSILLDIKNFWERRHLFLKAGVQHKRGILLWGPPGSGKSCIIQLVMEDVISRGGVGLNYNSVFQQALQSLRLVQPGTPVVVLMEDLDSILQNVRGGESQLLNLLDGAMALDRILFLASTNYPELLEARVVNRPSRFDKRYEIPFPTLASRFMYIQHLVAKFGPTDVKRWASDTNGLSFAHIKELFIAVNILGHDYREALSTLHKMKETISSEEGKKRK